MSNEVEDRSTRLETLPLRPAGPRSGFVGGTVQSIKDIWAHRELLGLLVRRELKAKYKDSVLGFFWTLMRPLAMLCVYYIAIGKFMGAEQVPGKNPGGIPQFAVFIFSGLTAWQLYSDIVMMGTGSIVGNAGLIKKVYLPREVFPLGSIGAALFNFSIQLGILVGATAVFGQFPTGSRWMYFPLALAVLVVFSTALALLLSAVNVYLRDVQYLVEILIMILFWASPVVYSWGLLSQRIQGFWLDLYLANPMTQVVLGFQRAFWIAGDGQPPPPSPGQSTPDHLGLWMVATLMVSLVLLWLGQRIFARLQSNFAQEL
jgi:ABC-2 type transport system permease protein